MWALFEKDFVLIKTCIHYIKNTNPKFCFSSRKRRKRGNKEEEPGKRTERERERKCVARKEWRKN